MNTSKYGVRVTSTNGLARYIPATATTVDKVASEESCYSSIIEADVLVDGEFRVAYINGARVFTA